MNSYRITIGFSQWLYRIKKSYFLLLIIAVWLINPDYTVNQLHQPLNIFIFALQILTTLFLCWQLFTSKADTENRIFSLSEQGKLLQLNGTQQSFNIIGHNLVSRWYCWLKIEQSITQKISHLLAFKDGMTDTDYRRLCRVARYCNKRTE